MYTLYDSFDAFILKYYTFKGSYRHHCTICLILLMLALQRSAQGLCKIVIFFFRFLNFLTLNWADNYFGWV